MKNTPKIRFKDYTDEWETRKLGEISEKVTEKNNDYEYTETLTNSAEFGIISQRDFFEKDISNPEKTDGYYIVREEDFVYNPRISTFAPVGPINRNKLGKTGIMSPLYTVFRTSNINRQYLEYYFKSTKWHNFMYINGDTGARADRFAIKNSVFMELPIPYPKNEEQQRIGDFLNNIDNLVSFYQQECEQLKTFKKMMLKKMFPQEGCGKPEFRFDGFTDDWEQRKLNEIVNVLDGDRGNNYPNGNEFQEKGHTLFLSASNVTTNGFVFDDTQYITEEKSNSMGNGKLLLDDIVLTSRGSIGHIAWYNKAIQQQVPFARINSGMLILRSKDFIMPCFIAQFLKSPLGKKQIELISFGSAQPQLTKKDVSNYVVSIPSDINEQIKLGVFFDNLDNLITLHHRKCDKLVEVKKYMLKNMFI